MAGNRKRYTTEDVRNNQFYQLPKFLFEDEFVKMSNDARVLYALLRDRHSLSLKNGWINKNNEVYLVYSRDEMGEMLNVSRPTVTKIVKELKKLGLIEEERVGQGQANLIFLTAVTLDNTEKERIFTSRKKESFPQEVKNLSPNKTDINNSCCCSDTQEKQSEDFSEKDINTIAKLAMVTKDVALEQEFVKNLLSTFHDVNYILEKIHIIASNNNIQDYEATLFAACQSDWKKGQKPTTQRKKSKSAKQSNYTDWGWEDSVIAQIVAGRKPDFSANSDSGWIERKKEKQEMYNALLKS